MMCSKSHNTDICFPYNCFMLNMLVAAGVSRRDRSGCSELWKCKKPNGSTKQLRKALK